MTRTRDQRGWTPREEDQLRTLRAEGLTLRLCGQRLGRSRASVMQKWRALRLGHECSKRYWTPEENERLTDLLDAHLTYPEIAACLGRSLLAVVVRADELRQAGNHNGELLAHQVARVFGVHWAVSGRWIKLGWLPAERGTSRRGRRDTGNVRTWAVQQADLERFIADHRYWPAWDPARMAPGRWREYAGAVRPRLRYLDAHEVGRRLGFCAATITRKCRAGELRAVCLVPGTPGVGGKWWVREDWLAPPARPCTYDNFAPQPPPEYPGTDAMHAARARRTGRGGRRDDVLALLAGRGPLTIPEVQGAVWGRAGNDAAVVLSELARRVPEQFERRRDADGRVRYRLRANGKEAAA